MRTYIHIPIEYEHRLQRLADRAMRTYHQQTAWLVCWAIDQVDSQGKDERNGQERARDMALTQEVDHASAP